MRLKGSDKFKKFDDLIGTRNRDLPACSIAPQSSTLPRISRRKLSLTFSLISLWQLHGTTEANHEEPASGQPMGRIQFE
jgi:hypothetical protein